MPLRFARSGDSSVRLGEHAQVTLTVDEPRLRGLLAAMLRDAWPPSAGAARTRHPIDLPAGERRRVDHRACARPGAVTGRRTG